MNTTDKTQLNINVLTQEQYKQAKDDVLTIYGKNNNSAKGSFNTMRFCIFEV